MKVALFGGTGFVGSYMVDALLDGGHEPALLVREGSEQKVRRKDECRIVMGDVTDAESVRETLSDSEAVIYLIGIIREFRRKGISYEALHFEGAKRVMNAAQELGVRRTILMSANGVKPDGTGYQRTKYLAEQYLRTTGLDWTVFRPSLIFGDPMGKVEFCSQLRDQLIKLPFPAPLFYSGLVPRNAGKFEMSPIHVNDVAVILTKALEMKETMGKIYELGGPDTFDWKRIIKTIGAAVGKRKWTVPAPALGIKLVAALFDRFAFFPITRDQITMLMEGNTCDSASVFELIEIEPTPFSVESLAYLKEQ